MQIKSTPLIPRRSYDSVFNQFDELLVWLDQLGIKINQHRIKQYSGILKHWQSNSKTMTSNEYEEKFPDILSAIFEICALQDIHSAFKTLPVSDLESIKLKLHEAVSGPVHRLDESQKTSKARNFLFEAQTAARLWRPENGVYTLLESQSDTGAYFENRRIWAECKRICSDKKLEKNVSKAASQLKKQILGKPGSLSRGLIVIDVSKLIDPGDRLLLAKNDMDLLNRINELSHKIVDTVNDKVNNTMKRVDRRVLGIMTYYSTMGLSESDMLPVRISQWLLSPRIGARKSDSELLKRLQVALKDTY